MVVAMRENVGERREVVRVVAPCEVDIATADAALTARERPDVALVGLGDSSQHALELIDQIVRSATCPVIALLETDDHEFVNEAAKRGIFAYITDGDPDQLQSSIDIVLRRFAEYQNLEGAFGRRAIIERAKGILMERHHIDADHAFELLRTHARSTNRKITDIAAAIVDGHALPPGPTPTPPRSTSNTPATGGSTAQAAATAGDVIIFRALTTTS